MHIVVIGAGYVGLVSAACFAELGVHVVCVDTDAGRIDMLKKGKTPIYEPGLEEMVTRNVASGRLSFAYALGEEVKNAQVVFIAVGTPDRADGMGADLKYVYQAARDIAVHLGPYTVVVTKSTVPVGTGRAVHKIIKDIAKIDFDVCSNPEFLREGEAIADFMRPNRVVLGSDSGRALDVMAKLYEPLKNQGAPLLKVGLETAELIKYAANAFLAMKITFINEISDLCEKVGADIQMVSKGIGLDDRIGTKFLQASPGYGGSCFPKDTKALMHTAESLGAPLRLISTAIDINEKRKISMAERIIKICGGDVRGKKIAVLGVTFKPGTDDMRESVSLILIPILQRAGAVIQAYDPVGMESAQTLLKDVQWCQDSYSAMTGACALVLLTDWAEFSKLDFEKMKQVMQSPTFIDFRNVYNPIEPRSAGVTYFSLGRE